MVNYIIRTRRRAESVTCDLSDFVTAQPSLSTSGTMFRSAVRAARPAALATRSSLKPQGPSSLRALHTTLRVSSGGHGPAPPQLYGAGGKAGQVPSDVDQATGIERLQLLGELEGFKVFDDEGLVITSRGTKANPTLVPSYVGIFACAFPL